jgi:hypothetical protein
MSNQCFFCKKYKNPGCSAEATAEEGLCPFRDPMSQDEIQETVDNDLKHITEVAQKAGVIPEGITIEEYFQAIHRKPGELPQDFC